MSIWVYECMGVWVYGFLSLTLLYSYTLIPFYTVLDISETVQSLHPQPAPVPARKATVDTPLVPAQRTDRQPSTQNAAFLSSVLLLALFCSLRKVYGFMGLWVYGYMGVWVFLLYSYTLIPLHPYTSATADYVIADAASIAINSFDPSYCGIISIAPAWLAPLTPRETITPSATVNLICSAVPSITRVPTSPLRK